MKILILMAGFFKGSISQYFGIFDLEKEELIIKGVLEKIGQVNSNFTFQNKSQIMPVKNCIEGVKLILQNLSGLEISAAAHRVVHGGEKFKEHCLIDNNVIIDIKECVNLAPLHNPYNLLTIETARNLLPGIPHIAVFDTCFHQTIPDYAYIYGIPYEYYQKYKIRRYGFHGTSHQYVARKIGILLNNSKVKIVSSHLGNGASVCAISSGESKDTSMGFTPLEGLIMNTRCGDLDPAIIPFLMEQEGFYQKEIEGILNKKSGLLGISGISSNIQELIEKSKEGNKQASLAINAFCYRLKKYICAYLGILGGADAIAFTGWVGESSPFIREKVLSNLEFLGIKLDPEKNNASLEEISKQNSKIKLFVIPTNEELIIAKEAKRVLEKIK